MRIRKLLISRGIFLIPLLSFLQVFPDNDSKLKALNNNNNCLSLVLYFDIDNTSNSYFNNIIYALTKFSEIFPDEKNTANIVLPEYTFQDKQEQKEFLSRITIDSKLWELNIVLSDSIFNSLPHSKGLAKYIFYKSQIPIAFGTCKWDDPIRFIDKFNCNNTNVNIDISLIDKTNIRKKVFSDNNIIEVIDSNRVLLLDDYYNKMFLFIFKDKKLTVSEFPCNFFDPTEVFCKYYSTSIPQVKIY